MRIRTTFIAASLAAALTLPVLAQSTNTPVIDQRQANQAQRIEQGKATGALTDKEAARLEKGQARVQAKENAAKADGKVTRAERKAIKRSQDRQSARIHKQKHDKQKKAPAAASGG
jgi:hypothetical protein